MLIKSDNVLMLISAHIVGARKVDRHGTGKRIRLAFNLRLRVLSRYHITLARSCYIDKYSTEDEQDVRCRKPETMTSYYSSSSPRLGLEAPSGQKSSSACPSYCPQNETSVSVNQKRRKPLTSERNAFLAVKLPATSLYTVTFLHFSLSGSTSNPP